MVSPKLPQRRQETSTNPYLLLCIKILLILLILLWLAPLVQSKHYRYSDLSHKSLQQASNSIRRKCERQCAQLPEESMNCIFECWWPDCVEQTLEPGQVDIPAAQAFSKCVVKGLREERKRERMERRKARG